MKLYRFNVKGETDGSAADVNLLGGKGANLAQMAALGYPVPPGMTIPTDACNTYLGLKEDYPRRGSARSLASSTDRTDEPTKQPGCGGLE